MESLAAQACGCPLATVAGGGEWRCPVPSLPGSPSGPPAHLPCGPPGRALGLWPGSVPEGATTLWQSSVRSQGPSKVPVHHQTCSALPTPSSVLAILPSACVPVPTHAVPAPRPPTAGSGQAFPLEGAWGVLLLLDGLSTCSPIWSFRTSKARSLCRHLPLVGSKGGEIC